MRTPRDRRRPSDKNGGKAGHEKRERDSEEEWRGIPIPQSDDSQSTEDDLSDESDHEKTQAMMGCVYITLRQRGDGLAFLLAPRLDGKIMKKDGLIIDTNEPMTKQPTEYQPTHENQLPIVAAHDGPPQWTQRLLAFQRQQLTKGYRKRTKLKAKLLRQIRKATITLGFKPRKMINTKVPRQYDNTANTPNP